MLKKVMLLAVVLATFAGMFTTGQADPAIACAPVSEGQTLNTATAVEWKNDANCELEPILSRNANAAIYESGSDTANRLAQGNIKKLKASVVRHATNPELDVMKFEITTQRALPKPNDLTSLPPAPYGGVHVLAVFQTNTLHEEQVVGPTLTGGVARLGPFRREDNFHWFVYYGLTLSEGQAQACGVGYYNTFGQFFTVLQQTHDTPGTTSCVRDDANKKVTITARYHTTYTLQPDNLARNVWLARRGQSIDNIKAFSWMDHEIGGPPPVGLVLGLTWYTDWLPSNSYQLGAFGGDPNSGGLPGERCRDFPIAGRIPNPLYDGNPCYTNIQTVQGNQVGTGFKATALKLSA